jgi:hypothetical protein
MWRSQIGPFVSDIYITDVKTANSGLDLSICLSDYKTLVNAP